MEIPIALRCAVVRYRSVEFLFSARLLEADKASTTHKVSTSFIHVYNIFPSNSVFLSSFGLAWILNSVLENHYRHRSLQVGRELTLTTSYHHVVHHFQLPHHQGQQESEVSAHNRSVGTKSSKTKSPFSTASFFLIPFFFSSRLTSSTTKANRIKKKKSSGLSQPPTNFSMIAIGFQPPHFHDSNRIQAFPAPFGTGISRFFFFRWWWRLSTPTAQRRSERAHSGAATGAASLELLCIHVSMSLCHRISRPSGPRFMIVTAFKISSYIKCQSTIMVVKILKIIQIRELYSFT